MDVVVADEVQEPALRQAVQEIASHLGVTSGIIQRVANPSGLLLIAPLADGDGHVTGHVTVHVVNGKTILLDLLCRVQNLPIATE